MKKISIKITAVAATILLLATVLPTAAFADGTNQSGNVGGSGDVTEVVLNVVVPTNLSFALDPFQVGDVTGTNGQIASTDYVVVNKSTVPVQAAYFLEVVPGGGVDVVATIASADRIDPAKVDKKIAIAALAAKTVATPPTDFATAPAGAAFTYDQATASTKLNFDASTKKANMVFVLGKATDGADPDDEPDTLAAANKGVASFQFYAELHTYADWEEGDVNVKGVYSLTPLLEASYQNSDFVADSWGVQLIASKANALTPPTVPQVGFVPNGFPQSEINLTYSVSSRVDIEIPFAFDGKTLKSITADNIALTTDDYDSDSSSITLVKNGRPTTAFLNNPATAPFSFDINVILSDDSVYTIKATTTL
jgi:hypothetical protein